MCNSGKYIERNPNMTSAGVPLVCDDGVKDSMNVYPRAELAEYWFRSQCPRAKIIDLFPTSPCLPNDSIPELLTPELKKSRFVKFREQFFEDLYLRKPELGRATPTHSKPDSITNENTCFGAQTHKSDPLYEVVLPCKSVKDVNREYIAWHEKYVLSHHHYLPGEKINRNYNEHFKPKATFGVPYKTDKTGAQVRRVLNQPDEVIMVKEVQKYYLDKSFGDFGIKINKFRDPHITDRHRIFGHPPNPDKCTLKDVVHGFDPCESSNELLLAIAYLKNERYRLNLDPKFDIFELEMILEKLDEEKTGYIPLTTAFSASRGVNIHFNENQMRTALTFFKLLENPNTANERIKIEDFSKALQIRYSLPDVTLQGINPSVDHDMDTTYRILCRDHLKPAPEGIPCDHKKKSKEENLDEIEPGAFQKPREKAQLKRIFAKLVCPDTFEEIWKKVVDSLQPENDLISIDEFRAAMKDMRSKYEAGKSV